MHKTCLSEKTKDIRIIFISQCWISFDNALMKIVIALAAQFILALEGTIKNGNPMWGERPKNFYDQNFCFFAANQMQQV